MTIPASHPDYPRALETIFKDHIENTGACCQALSAVFANLGQPEAFIAKVKQLEQNGDRLTAEAYHSLETLPFSEMHPSLEQFVQRLDDITDGINNTARLIDICLPTAIETSAQDIHAILLAMIEKLQGEIGRYPDNQLAEIKACRESLKANEEQADAVYHEWRKTQRRIKELSLVDEANWTEIMGILEQTTDAAYHAGLLLERITRYRLQPAGDFR